MTRSRTPFLILAVLAAAAICLAPVSGAASPETTTAPATAGTPHVTATVSAASVTAGTPVTVSGTSVGPGTTVQVWAFAGNYVNVSTVPVAADGTYARTYDTTGLPPATYYVFVQNPGSDSSLQVTTSGFSGTVINAATGAVIFNFTGTGSVQDSAAATALSEALGAQSGDDIYTKTQFVITAPGSDRDAHGCIGSAGYTWCEAQQKCLREWEEPCTATPSPSPTKSPLTAGIAAGAIALFLAARKGR